MQHTQHTSEPTASATIIGIVRVRVGSRVDVGLSSSSSSSSSSSGGEGGAGGGSTAMTISVMPTTSRKSAVGEAEKHSVELPPGAVVSAARAVASARLWNKESDRLVGDRWSLERERRRLVQGDRLLKSGDTGGGGGGEGGDGGGGEGGGGVGEGGEGGEGGGGEGGSRQPASQFWAPLKVFPPSSTRLRVEQEQASSREPEHVSASSQAWHIRMIVTVSLSANLLPRERALALNSTVIAFRFESRNAWSDIVSQPAVITMQSPLMLDEPLHLSPGSESMISHAPAHATKHAKPMARCGTPAGLTQPALLPGRPRAATRAGAGEASFRPTDRRMASG
eukprot:scaffold5790_cov63-Phaeocystis_antarctica.AAC.3